MPVHLANWSEREWTQDRIDRLVQRQNLRLGAGIYLHPDCQMLTGALSVFQGRGKYLQHKQSTFCREPIPETLAHSIARVWSGETQNVAERIAISDDLATHQAQLGNRLLRLAGKYIDRVLAVTLDDKVTSIEDFDGRRTTLSFYRPARLAEQTGANIIESISERDREAGGSGEFLDALCAWMVYANRDPDSQDQPPRGTEPSKNKTSSTSLAINPQRSGRILLIGGLNARAYFLPASDGSDDFVPEIVAQRMGPIENQAGLSWDDLWRSLMSRLPQSVVLDSPIIVGNQFERDQILQIVREWGCAHSPTPSTPEIEPSWDECEALLTATWGMMFTDQMPVNLPALTGSSSQRILGSVTPGKPATWRNLLVEMNDRTTPVMKLRDAI